MERALILNRFRIVDEIGRGGFGTVYRAWDERLEREVAVKAIPRGGVARRVVREAQAAARLNHPSIVTLYELGEDDSAAYLVSELVDGESLRELLSGGRLTDREMARAGASICEALAHAHERGVIHRDVKPENIALAGREDEGAGSHRDPTPRSRAMLMDFGVASICGGPGLTATGEVVGTLAYMAPEQAEGEAAGAEVDVYSLGLVLYEAWSGRNPVVRPTPAATARAIGAPVPPLGRTRPDLPSALTSTVDACLEPDCTLRPDPLELRKELRHADPVLDDTRALPDRNELGHAAIGRISVARLAALAGLATAIGWMAWGAARPGLALVLAALAFPVPLLLDRVRAWPLPLAAPALGAVGLAPLYPALAGLAGGALRSAILGFVGWCWLAVAEAVLTETLLFAALSAPAPGWETSPQIAAESLLVPLFLPASLLAAAAWAGAAGLLGALLEARSLVLRAVGVLCWGAGLVAIHRLLAGGASDPATAGFVAALVATLAIGAWARAVAPSRTARSRRKDPGSAVMVRGTA